MKINQTITVDSAACAKDLAEFIGKDAKRSSFVKEGWVLDKKALPSRFAEYQHNAVVNGDGEAYLFCMTIVSSGKATAGPLEKLWKRFDPRTSRFCDKQDQEYKQDQDARRSEIQPLFVEERKSKSA